MLASEIPVWVMDRNTDIFDAPVAMPNDALTKVRSVDGVEWAEPFILAKLNVKLQEGKQQGISVVGVDAGSLVGIPPTILKGDIKNINLPESVAIDKNQLAILGNPKLGDAFEINDQRAKIIAVIDSPPNVFSTPVFYTTLDKAYSYIPSQRKLLSYVMVKTSDNVPKEEVIKRINEQTGLLALTQEDFNKRTIMWYMKNTGIPYNMGMTVILGVVFGIIVTAQAFYTFVIENIKQFATLKAMGVNNRTLTKMILLQSFVVGAIGYGIAMGVISVLGSVLLNVSKIAYYTPYQLPIIASVILGGVCLFSSSVSIVRLYKIEPATVFRG
jgi:putative ABC transport system permease protein